MEGIQRNVAERSKKKALSRTFHAKTDSQMIAGWRADLDSILLTFNVRSVVSAWPVLIVHPQTELGLNIYEAVSEVRDDFTNMHLTVTDTRAMISDMHRRMLGDQEGANDLTQTETRSATLTTIGSSIL